MNSLVILQIRSKKIYEMVIEEISPTLCRDGGYVFFYLKKVFKFIQILIPFDVGLEGTYLCGDL